LASPVCEVDLVSLWQPPKAQPCGLLRAPLWNDGSTPSWLWHLLHRAASTIVRRAVWPVANSIAKAGSRRRMPFG
jgi:hypothetical protein